MAIQMLNNLLPQINMPKLLFFNKNHIYFSTTAPNSFVAYC